MYGINWLDPDQFEGLSLDACGRIRDSASQDASTPVRSQATYPPFFPENEGDLNGIGVGHLTPGIECFERFSEFRLRVGQQGRLSALSD